MNWWADKVPLLGRLIFSARFLIRSLIRNLAGDTTVSSVITQARILNKVPYPESGLRHNRARGHRQARILNKVPYPESGLRHNRAREHRQARILNKVPYPESGLRHNRASEHRQVA